MVRIFDLFSHQGLAFSASIYIISTLLGYKVDCGFPLDGRHFRSHFSWTVAILALPMLTCDAFLTNGHHFRVSNIEFLSNGSHYRQHFRRTVASFASPSMGFCRMVCILYRISNERSPFSRFPWSRSCPRRNFLPTVCISTSIVPSCRIGRKGVRMAMFSYTNRHVSDRRSFWEFCRTYARSQHLRFWLRFSLSRLTFQAPGGQHLRERDHIKPYSCSIRYNGRTNLELFM